MLFRIVKVLCGYFLVSFTTVTLLHAQFAEVLLLDQVVGNIILFCQDGIFNEDKVPEIDTLDSVPTFVISILLPAFILVAASVVKDSLDTLSAILVPVILMVFKLGKLSVVPVDSNAKSPEYPSLLVSDMVFKLGVLIVQRLQIPEVPINEVK